VPITPPVTPIQLNPIDLLWGKGRPDGYFAQNPNQLDSYAGVLGGTTTNGTLTQNVLFEFYRRIAGNSQIPLGPLSGLTNNQFFREGVNVRDDILSNLGQAYSLLRGPGATDPRLRMDFNQGISQLGSVTFALSQMQSRGWSAAANTGSGTSTNGYVPLTQAEPMNAGNNSYNYVGAPAYSTTPYQGNFNTAQTSPTYANFVLQLQPAWMN
jgi:hypothetical protein